MSNSVIQKAVEFMGTQAALAAAIGASQPLVSKWQRGKARVSAEFVIPIESVTNGVCSRYELRPDLYPAPDTGARI